MLLDNFCNTSAEKINISREQASNFAKQVADDFNPLHDVDAKRFCVPGDLLFALVLSKAGLYQDMTFTFSGMVTEESSLVVPDTIDSNASVVDTNGKEYMRIETKGPNTKQLPVIESLIQSYVEFSGHTFPDMLMELMKKEDVMINPARPMIMYESMSIHLDTLDVKEVKLAVSETTLTVDGKRGKACLMFNLLADGRIIGSGKKHMLLSGLRAYCPTSAEAIIAQHHEKKSSYKLEKLAS